MRRHPELQTREDEFIGTREKEKREERRWQSKAATEVWFEKLQMRAALARFTVVAAAGSRCPGRRSSQQLKDYPPHSPTPILEGRQRLIFFFSRKEEAECS